MVSYSMEERKPSASEMEAVRSLTEEYLNNSDPSVSLDEFLATTGRDNDAVLKYHVSRYSIGLGPLEPMMRDSRIEDISCDGPGIPIYVFLKEYGYIPTNIMFKSEDDLNSYVRKLAQFGGKQISASSPVVESTLPDGSRIQATIGRYLTTNGPSFSIRRFRELPMSPIDLMELGTADAGILAYLWTIIEYGANIMIVGGTASGKTTFLNAILSFAPSDRKIVSIEDTRELNLAHSNWIATVVRSSPGYTDNERDGSDISMFDLLESALRHRPNYIVLGEVRGSETFTVFQAMSAGRFGLGTFHADDVPTFIHRLEARPINVPRSLLVSLDTIVILKTGSDSGRLRRFVSEISEIVGLEQGNNDIVTNTLLRKVGNTYLSSEYSYVIRRIASREGIEESTLVSEMERRRTILGRMAETGIVRFTDAFRFFSLYSRDRDLAMKILGI
ncbi:MAG: type II/IV secretion system ATPase subunit [Candidatus Thermoplasmatota archaeon]|nr:type II/IV secretion system ATPase subunit [Candidatus Thermoplasmatota archaeon]